MQAVAEISKKRSLKDNTLDQLTKTIPLITSHRRHTNDTYKQLNQVNKTANGDSGPLVLKGKVQAPPIGT